MFQFIKQAFHVLLGFSESLATKCILINNEPCSARYTIKGLNCDEISQTLAESLSVYD